jgi:hypothetical protein
MGAHFPDIAVSTSSTARTIRASGPRKRSRTGMTIADRAVLVTGANRGIGQALVEA